MIWVNNPMKMFTCQSFPVLMRRTRCLSHQGQGRQLPLSKAKEVLPKGLYLLQFLQHLESSVPHLSWLQNVISTERKKDQKVVTFIVSISPLIAKLMFLLWINKYIFFFSRTPRHIRVASDDLAPTSSTKSLIPNDYTPVASLLTCEKSKYMHHS